MRSGFFTDSPAGEKQAWLIFVEEGRYDIAQPQDFNFPAAAEKLQPADIKRAPTQPYVGGDTNRDGIPNDFAAIVVDKTITDVTRFSLVIFTRRSRDSELYDRQFLFSGRDLSKTLLEWWSGGLAVREYFEDGTYRYCHVKWNSRSGQYYCEAETQ